MRESIVKFVLCLLVAALAAQATVSATGRIDKKKPNTSRSGADLAYVLEDIMKSPKEYLERQSYFYCRFAEPFPVPEERPVGVFDFERLPNPMEIDVTVASHAVLSSLPIWAGKEKDRARGDRMPPFTFEPDKSPTIISGFQAPEEVATAMPVRNPSLFHRAGGERQPAEIIEKEQMTPRVPHDASTMTPSSDGSARRAEVILPTSAIGVGMASDYSSG